MKQFNKLEKRDWKAKTNYQLTDEETEILNRNSDELHDLELLSETRKDVASKSTENPTEIELVWLNQLEERLKKGLETESYRLCAIEVKREVNENNGIEFSGIFNYYIGEELIQSRF